ncbi:hypothetical protein PR202_gb04433 [Eleusine coracana subsp. coracana]|uniref:Uncharacterized protein n=1 Tax=Eleusine coracana subsp. coracana TaxID=191504 RepID=A0AAV5E3N7_ELECO|nr:hypothetical protein PR202_gb04433 [Eleusine coracana subsp. coracana]
MPAVLAAFASLRAAAAIASANPAFPSSHRLKHSHRFTVSLLNEIIDDLNIEISCVCHSTYRTPGFEHSYVCCKDDGFEVEIAYAQDDYVVKEVETALTEVMHVYDDGGADLDEDSDEDDDAPLSLESDSTDDLVGTDLDVVIGPAFPIGGSFESSVAKSDDGNSSTIGTLPLVSAMKGTRAKQGISTKLSVSWAPDVYDPPVTSDSHTVRGHQRSSRKSHYKYKPAKSSSNRSASSSKRDKKHSRHTAAAAYSTSSDDSSRADSHYIESAKAYPSVPPESAAVPEAVPVLKTIDQVKCATSCKEKPFNLLSRQFSPARYKGMFSFWSQNQLAS